MDTAQLIANCRSGDEHSIEILVSQNRKTLYRLAFSILEDPAEADEATQEAFIAALGALESYRGDSSLTTWLYTITVNTCRGRLRKRQTRERLWQTLQTIFRLSGQLEASPEASLLQNESDTTLWKALHKLGEKHRLPLILRYYHDLSVAEIAQVLRIPEGTVHSRLSISREKLKVELKLSGFFLGEAKSYERD